MGNPAGYGVSAAGLPNTGDQANAVLAGKIAAVGPTAPFAFRGPFNLALYASLNHHLTVTKGSLAASVDDATGLANGDAIKSSLVPPGTTMQALSGTNLTLAPPPVTYNASNLSTQSTLVTLPPGSNVAALLGATVTVPSTAEGLTLAVNTTVAAIVQNDVAPAGISPGQPGIIQLSAAPTAVPTVTGTPAVTTPLQFAPTGNAITASGTDNNAVFTGAAITFNATVQLERSFDGCLTWIVCNFPPFTGTPGTPALAQWTGAAVTPVDITIGEPEKSVPYRFNCTAYTSGTINYRLSQTGGAAESLAVGPLFNG